jgi:hypothetical protein
LEHIGVDGRIILKCVKKWCENVEWISLRKATRHWTFGLPYKAKTFLSRWTTISFSRRSLLCGVCYKTVILSICWFCLLFCTGVKLLSRPMGGTQRRTRGRNGEEEAGGG